MHSEHSVVPTADAYVPGEHGVHSALAFCPAKVPIGQKWQAFAPVSFWNLPTSHSKHRDPAPGAYQPGEHDVHSLFPVPSA